jgi:hypothetical protein
MPIDPVEDFPALQSATGIRPSVQNNALHLFWEGLDVALHEVPQLRVYPIRIPAGQMQHTHECKMALLCGFPNKFVNGINSI